MSSVHKGLIDQIKQKNIKIISTVILSKKKKFQLKDEFDDDEEKNT